MSLEKPKLNVGKRWASGTALSSSTGVTRTTSGNNTQTRYLLTVTGLAFRPRMVFIFDTILNQPKVSYYDDIPPAGGVKMIMESTAYDLLKADGTEITSNGFSIPCPNSSTNYTWIAYE